MVNGILLLMGSCWFVLLLLAYFQRKFEAQRRQSQYKGRRTSILLWDHNLDIHELNPMVIEEDTK